MRILFMGTPDFAAVALNAIASSRFGGDIIGVVTKTDTPKNRGHKLLPPPVKTEAEKLGLKVYQPETLKDGAFKEELDALAPDVIIVAAYGKILPEYILNAPKHGCINIHGSLLPKYRGAAPIQRAIMDGESEIGITIMQMDKGLDTGDMLMRRGIHFNDEPFGVIHDRLAELGGEMIVETLEALSHSELSPTKQDDALSTYAAKIEKSDCKIDLSLSAREINNKIRALSPAPCAMVTLGEKTIKITSATVIDKSGNIGEVISVSPKGDGYIDIGTGSGVIRVLRLIPEGKKEMSAGDFVRGRGISAGDMLNTSEIK